MNRVRKGEFESAKKRKISKRSQLLISHPPPLTQKRKAQNRASQRAFRERKQDYVTSLEQKIAAYENEEVTKSVELQKLARNLRDENERLKSENLELKENCRVIGEELRWFREGNGKSREVDKERDRDGGCRAPTHEKARDDDGDYRIGLRDLSTVYKRPDKNGNGSGNVNVFQGQGESFPLDGMGSSTSKLRSLSLESNLSSGKSVSSNQNRNQSPISSTSRFRVKSNLNQPSSSNSLNPMACQISDRDCGFCTESSPCVCAGEAELNLEENMEVDLSTSSTSSSNLIRERTTTAISVNSLLGPDSSTPLPAYAIRKLIKPSSLNGERKSKPKLWEIHEASSSTSSPNVQKKPKLWSIVPASFSNLNSKQISPSIQNQQTQKPNGFSLSSLPCSGDPSTCSACSQDPDLAIFCEAINGNLNGSLKEPAVFNVGNSVKINIRRKEEGKVAENSNNSKLWSSSPSKSTSTLQQKPSFTLPPPSTIHSHRKETIPEAWEKIRSHPKFNQWDGGLSLLAEVVSGRSSPVPSKDSRRINVNHADGGERFGFESTEASRNSNLTSTSTSKRPSMTLQRKISISRTGSNLDPNLKLAPLNSTVETDRNRINSNDQGNGTANGSGNDGDETSSMGDLSEERERDRGNKRRRLYVETEDVDDALALLDRGILPDERERERRPVLPCPCPWKPSV